MQLFFFFPQPTQPTRLYFIAYFLRILNELWFIAFFRLSNNVLSLQFRYLLVFFRIEGVPG